MCDLESSSDENSSSGDFFGLKDSDWNSQLQEATEQAYEFLRADLTLHESAVKLNSSVCGPEIRSESPRRTGRCSDNTSLASLKRPSQSPHFVPPKTPRLDVQQNLSLRATSVSSRGTLDTSLVISNEESDSVEYCARAVKRSFRRIKAHDKAIVAASWAPEPYGKLVLTASHDSHIKLWQSTTGNCLYDFPAEAGVRSAQFTLCGRKVVHCGWDRRAVVVDPTSNAVLFSCGLSQRGSASCLRMHPSDESNFFVGCKDVAQLWDMRQDPAAKPARTFPLRCGEVLDLLCLRGGQELACSGDLVARDSCETALSVWDVGSGARLSGQLYQERYTIPCLESLSPETMLAQTNGDYIAMFDAQRPYRLNKKRRFEGHKVSGHPVRCSASPDGALVCSGDAEGVPHIYSAHRTTTVGVVSLTGDGTPATHPYWHPSRPGLLLIGCADGYLHLCR